MPRIKLIVYVDLDNVPGAFHTKEDAVYQIEDILKRQIGHYNPIVTYEV